MNNTCAVVMRVQELCVFHLSGHSFMARCADMMTANVRSHMTEHVRWRGEIVLAIVLHSNCIIFLFVFHRKTCKDKEEHSVFEHIPGSLQIHQNHRH